MIRWLQIPTGVALMALLASPAEGNDDLGTGVSWRRAVLSAIQAACAQKSPSLCPAPDRTTATDATRSAPASQPRARGRTGRAPKQFQWGPYGEGGTLRIRRVNVDSSTAIVTFSRSGQVLNRQENDNTDSLRSNYTFAADGSTATFGALFRLQPIGNFFVEARGGLLFGDVEIDATESPLNTVTKTGGNDWGGAARVYLQFQPQADDGFFLWSEAQGKWLNFGGKRNPAELIPEATIESDTNDVTLRLLTAGVGVGFFLDPDRKYSVKTGIGLNDLSVVIARTLVFGFTAANQSVTSEGKLKLGRNALTIDASVRARWWSYLDVELGGSIGSGVRGAFFRTGVNW